ncbi:MAG: stage II sporulation protein AB (anti-sigma F factor) [Bacillota bacterium]|nr:MAG: stage II sporulation protein AB (anti-sigma F factor) [Bacillota bacterium]MBS3950360.1 anti-sigma F factor [Peptococcaceae bacterium]
MENWFEMRLPALSVNEKFARTVAALFALQVGDWSLADINEIKTAVSEAVTNVIIHGYEQTTGEITLRGQVSEGRFEIVIQDHGQGIENVEQAREPLFTTKPEQERSGLGFTVMESFMDELTVSSAPGKGTVIKMVKYFVSPTPQ